MKVFNLGGRAGSVLRSPFKARSRPSAADRKSYYFAYKNLKRNM